MFKNGFNRSAKNDFKNAFPRIQSHAHLKNSRRAQFNCLEHYQKISNNKGSRSLNRSSKMRCSKQICDFLCCLKFSDNVPDS